MHTRLHGRPPRALRTALTFALLACGTLSPAASARAANYWHLGIPPESLARWTPRTPEEAARPPGRLAGGPARTPRPASPATARPAGAGDYGWSPLSVPGTRYLHESVIDPLTHRVVVFGGFGHPAGPAPELASAGPLDDAGPWQALGLGSTEAPARRLSPAVAYDPGRHALLVFGGQALDGTGDLLGDLWSLSLEPGGTWERLVPAGPPPPARRFASLVHDAPHDRFLLAGGYGPGPLAEFWELRFGPSPVWRPLVFSNGAAANLGAVIADPVRGDGWCVAWQNEIHHLAIGEDLVTAGAALAIEPDSTKWGGADLLLAGFDPLERRLLWFDWQGTGPSHAFLDRPSWFALDGSHALERVSVAGTAPANRHLFASHWDSDGRRLVLTGGYDDDVTYFGDAWQLGLPASLPTPVAASLRFAESDARGVRLAWRVTDAPGARAVVERSADGVAWETAGEARGSGTDERAWEGPPLAPRARAAFRLVVSPDVNATRTGAVWVSGPAPAALALAPLRSPAGPELAVSLSLAPGTPARLRVLDAAGRVVAEARPPEGATVYSFGRAAAPGLYFAELTQGGERRVARLVTLR